MAFFMTEHANYWCNVMLFGLKNVGATYQLMVNKIFEQDIKGV